MDLANNKFSRFIPKNMSQHLKILILRGNRFEGMIPQDLSNLSELFHLDLAENQLSGSILVCLENMFNMMIKDDGIFGGFIAQFDLHIKDQIYEHLSNGERRTIDFS
ncbi:putative histone deacetylase [Medicago truncatula]|uniref:Putative histone deacetylase n=1 Tax=Medicago truncatula TaxID=3880 RepID=A0A396IN93_MEDTR|nr:putative histone deacetylase [Medicago truncatula]